MKYSDKLRDPRWQKMRLKILERDNFKCQDCGNTDKTLHVHHLKYVKGCDPWEYNTRSLRTLCELCHEGEHEGKKYVLDQLLEFADTYLLRWEIDQLGAFLDPRHEGTFKNNLIQFIRKEVGVDNE